MTSLGEQVCQRQANCRTAVEPQLTPDEEPDFFLNYRSNDEIERILEYFLESLQKFRTGGTIDRTMIT